MLVRNVFTEENVLKLFSEFLLETMSGDNDDSQLPVYIVRELEESLILLANV